MGAWNGDKRKSMKIFHEKTLQLLTVGKWPGKRKLKKTIRFWGVMRIFEKMAL
jgi:hypothetical protein